MRNIYKVTNGFIEYDEVFRVVLASDEEEAEHLAMISFKESDGYDKSYYTGLEVQFIYEFESGSQVIW